MPASEKKWGKKKSSKITVKNHSRPKVEEEKPKMNKKA